MLSPTAATIRLTLHVLAATIWVGGQFTLAGLLPVLRRHEGLAKNAARAFNRIAWPAFAILVLTGIWNVVEVQVGDTSIEYQITLFVKLVVVAASGISAAAHIGARSRQALAFWGAMSGLTAIAAVFVGIMLAAG